MILSEVEAIISREYSNWKKTEERQPIDRKRDTASATFMASIELEAPRRLGQSPISNVYRLHFTSPLSGSVLYGITRDVKFPHLPKDRIVAGEWVKTLRTY